MNLLLLLSAFVTALTGAITGVQRVQMPAVTERSVDHPAARVGAAVAAIRPVQPLPILSALVDGPVGVEPPVVAIIAPWASRRRE